MQSSGRLRVEVVVVLLLATVAVGLILAAVARVREVAAVAGCQNNLKQISMAVHGYRDATNRLPPLTDQDTSATTGGLTSVFFNLTPYVEARPRIYSPGQSPPTYYHAPSSVAFPFHHKDGTLDTLYGGAANQVWRTFLDPGDATANQLRDVPMTLPDGSTGHYAAGSYAANGLLPWGNVLSWETRNPVLFAERPQVCRPSSGDPVYNLWGLGFYSPHFPAFAALTPSEPPGLLSTGQVAPAGTLLAEMTVEQKNQIPVRVGRRDAAPVAPDFPTPFQSFRGNRSCDPQLPGSSHLAGMHAAMIDGSVRVFGYETEPWVFWAACMPTGPANIR